MQNSWQCQGRLVSAEKQGSCLEIPTCHTDWEVLFFSCYHYSSLNNPRVITKGVHYPEALMVQEIKLLHLFYWVWPINDVLNVRLHSPNVDTVKYGLLWKLGEQEANKSMMFADTWDFFLCQIHTADLLQTLLKVLTFEQMERTKMWFCANVLLDQWVILTPRNFQYTEQLQ